MSHTGIRSFVTIGVAAAILAITCSPALGQTPDGLQEEQVMMTMPDGVRLRTEIYRPAVPGPVPAILVRSPYGGGTGRALGRSFVPHGYAVVYQNVRGQGGSEGDFVPFTNEKADGAAALDWILEQPWCDGSVGLWGVSYPGYCAWQVAESGHPALKAMMATSSWADLDTFMAHQGAFQLQAHLRWFIEYAAGQEIPQQAWQGIFRALPLSQFFQGAEEVSEAAAEPFDYSRVRIPVHHMTGWFDYVYPNVMEAYRELTSAGHAPVQFLTVGPWAHNDYFNGVTQVGEVDFGSAAAMEFEEALELARAWFDAWIKEDPTALESREPVKLFVLGERAWRTYRAFPPPAVEPRNWYLGSEGTASETSGGGRLLTSQPTEGGTDRFVSDPNDPVPTWGGAASHAFPEILGPREQRRVEEREDVLVFTSPPLPEPLSIVGSVHVDLFASSTAPSTDFVARLAVVHPDGRSVNLVDGIVRGAYEGSGGGLPEVPAGEVGHYRIELGATAVTVEAGARLRLQVASTNFPRYDRNPNTGEDPFTAARLVPATQTIHHGPAHPSRLVLPVIPSGTGR